MNLLIWAVALCHVCVATQDANDEAGNKGVSYEPFDASVLSDTSFFEQFLDTKLSPSGWKPSGFKEDKNKAYVGRWAIEDAYKYPGFHGDTGLVMKTPAAHHAISYKFSTPFNNTDNDLVLQYEVKTQNGLRCGGAYIKLLNEDFESHGEFSAQTPFQLMFGPDRCGSNDKIHFIITRTNPITGVAEEKHLAQAPMSRSTQLSTLYTLVFKKNADFEIRINGQVVKAGNLVEKPHLLKPKLNPPREIVDTLDIKPDDWEELEFIADETAEKPADYDEKFGKSYIADPNSVKPEGWLEDEPEYILDPFAEKPQEWDEEEDGEWEVPVIKNPKCDVGCGKWEAPLIANPTYKGPWIQPVVKNPNYKGEWTPRMIPNPSYYEDKNPSNLDLIGGLGFELWSVESDILFDNIYLGHSIKEAEHIGNKTFLPKLDLEAKDYEINRPKAAKEPARPPKAFDDLYEDEDEGSTIGQVFTFFKLVFQREFLNMKDFWFLFMGDPLDTISSDPLKSVVYSGVFVFIFTLIFGSLNVLMFLYSGWIKETKEAINKGAAAAHADISGTRETELPKIVEIDDEGENIKSTSSAKVANTARRRK